MWPTDLYQVVLQFWHVAHSWLEFHQYPLLLIYKREAHLFWYNLLPLYPSHCSSIHPIPSDAGLVTSSNTLSQRGSGLDGIGEQLTNLSQAGWQQRKKSRHEGKEVQQDRHFLGLLWWSKFLRNLAGWANFLFFRVCCPGFCREMWG